MGQSRKTPSRGTSATSTPAKARSATPAAPSGVKATNGSAVVNDVSHPASSQSPSKTSKSKKSSKHRNSSKSTSFIDHLVRGALVAFAVWALTVCPSDTRLESPTCRALHSWRVTLEPHLVKPINTVLQHPSIHPIVETITPHYNEAVRRATPVIQSIQTKAAPHVHALRIKTQTLAKPYIRKAQLEYDARVQPYVAKAEPYYTTARHYTQRGQILAQTHLGPHVSRAQVVAKEQWETFVVPKVLIPAWEQLQLLPVWLEARFGDQARALKSTYVDAQIKKMRAKIQELSGHTAVISKVTTSSSTPRASVISAKVSSVVENLTARAKTATSSLESLTIVEDAASTHVSTTSAPSAEPVSTASSKILSVSESVEERLSSKSHASASSVAPKSSISSETPESTPSPVAEAPAPEPEAEDDPLAFLEAFTSTSTPAVTTTEAERPLYTPPTDEEIAAAKIQTAEKRKDLETRHAQWEAKIDDAGKAGRARVISDINKIRSDAVASLSDTTNPESIGAQVANFRSEGVKALKGTRAYADKLMKGHYHGAEKIGLFDSVVQKVDTRYAEGAKTLSDKIAQWWADVRDEVDKVAINVWQELDDIAGSGQSDLGMDYSYLDDVTTQDWARYHDLINRAKLFRDRYENIIAGTAVKAPVDPIPAALHSLQSDLQDVLANFQADLINVRDEGFRLIKGKPVTEASSSPAQPSKEPSFSILPVVEARDEFVGRGREEVLEALNRAGEKVTGTSEKAKPTKGSILKNVNDVVDAIFDEASDLYEGAAEIIHDATRAASRAVGATPTPETFSESVESVIGKASSVLPNVKVPSGDDIKASAAEAYASASTAVHTATRKAGKAAGVKVQPEGVKEHVEDIVEEVSSKVVDTASTVSSVASSVYEEASSTVADTAASVTSAAANVYKTVSSSIESAGESASSVASSVYEDASSVVRHATRSVSSAIGITPSPESFAESTESIKAKVHSMTRQAAKAAGISVSPEGAREHIASVVEEISSTVSSVASPASSVAASVYTEAEEFVGTVTSKVSDSAASGSSVASSAYEEASSAVHSAVRKAAKAAGVHVEPEGAQEYLESIAEEVMAKVHATAVHPASSVISSVYAEASSSVHTATRQAAKAAGIKVAPEGVQEHIESLTENVSSSVVGAASSASIVASSAYEAASSAVHSGARKASKSAGFKPKPTGVKESVEDLVEDVSSTVLEAASSASSVASSVYSDASSVVSHATRSAKSAAGATPSPENLAESISSIQSKASSLVTKASAAASDAYATASTKVAGATHEEL